MTPAERLSGAFTGLTREEIAALGQSIGATPRITFYASQGQPIPAEFYLKFCGKLGIDPVSGKPRAAMEVGSFHWKLLGAAVKLCRHFRHDIGRRKAAEQIGISPTSLLKLERGQPIATDLMLKACAWLTIHPFCYVDQRVTVTEAAE